MVYISVRCQWRLLLECYASWRAVHSRFKNWCSKGVLNYVFAYSKNQADLESTILDRTIVRAHACSSDYKKNSQEAEALGRSKGGFTTKIHAMVCALGNPLKFILIPGQRNDITQAKSLIEDIEDTTIIPDKAYDSNNFI